LLVAGAMTLAAGHAWTIGGAARDWVSQEHFLEFGYKEPFDAIVNLGVSEHLPDYGSTVKQYERLLKPGGRVYLDAYSGDRFNMTSFLTKWVFEGNTSPLNLAKYTRALETTDLEVLLLQNDAHNYYLTCKKWGENLDAVREEVEARWGTNLHRRFRLYLYGSAFAFLDGQLSAHRMILENRRGLRRRRAFFGRPGAASGIQLPRRKSQWAKKTP
jgi:cyclopropane-fatty-acyl-phospholipid synthase